MPAPTINHAATLAERQEAWDALQDALRAHNATVDAYTRRKANYAAVYDSRIHFAICLDRAESVGVDITDARPAQRVPIARSRAYRVRYQTGGGLKSRIVSSKAEAAHMRARLRTEAGVWHVQPGAVPLQAIEYSDGTTEYTEIREGS